MREQIQIAAKLYRCQEAAQQLYGDEYKAKVKTYIDYIKAFSAKHNLETLPAVISICKDQIIRSNGVTLMLFMAAAVEIIEPSKPKHGKHQSQT